MADMHKYHIPLGENANSNRISAEEYEKAGYLPSYGYVRVSTKGQADDDKFGIDAQKSAVKKFAMARRYYIKKWFVDVCSGVSSERPELENIIFYEKVPDGGTMPVFAFKSDRIARDTKLYFYFLYELEKKGFKLQCVTEEFETEGEFANLYRSMLMFVAEQERKNIRQRTMQGKKIKQNRGGYIGGNVPYGYYSTAGHLEVQLYEAYAVKWIYHATYNLGMNKSQIVKELTKHCIRTRNDKSWHISTISNILKNKRFYQGYLTTMDGQEVKGSHKPIIRSDECKSLVALDERGNFPLRNPQNNTSDVTKAEVDSVIKVKQIKNYDDITNIRRIKLKRLKERKAQQEKEGSVIDE